MRKPASEFLVMALLFVAVFCAGLVRAETVTRDYYREMGSFAEFIGALHGAKDAYQSGQDEVEQLYLEKAENVLDKIELAPATALVRQDFKGVIVQHAFSRAHGSESPRLHQLYRGLVDPTQGGLYEHLTEAMRCHKSRMPYYAGQTHGKSDAIFKKIAILQRLNLPVAWYIDLQARRFQRSGTPIVTADLVSMKSIFPADRPTAFKGIMTTQTLNEVRRQIKAFQKKAMRSLRFAAFYEVAAAAHELATSIRAIEKQHGAHLAMTIHMLDSVGLAALHASDYQKRTAGETDGLARQFLAMQMFPLQECLPTDHDAQKLHAMGVGVIVNDVPEIPFLQEWEAGQKKLSDH
ncbi:MAG TPA: hypothetical protein PLM07_11735 [Candidatus Rifleibacterium sp.]|nr:hypothetical protein [Candidatus Rifleibacterium sp.]HPT46558.1 hypothetical protein [Candidatus Rifleibacterium sp.]